METFSLRLWRAVAQIFFVELFWFLLVGSILLFASGWMAGFTDEGPDPFTTEMKAILVMAVIGTSMLGWLVWHLYSEVENRAAYWIPASSAYALAYLVPGYAHWLLIFNAILVIKLFFLMGGWQMFRRST